MTTSDEAAAKDSAVEVEVEEERMTFEYDESSLKSALIGLATAAAAAAEGGSGDADPLQCRHMHGHSRETGVMNDDHELSMLQRITAVRVLDYERIKSDPNSPSESDLLDASRKFRSSHGPALDLRSVIRSRSPSMCLAAEFKRASPSKGDIAPDLNAGDQARIYAGAGASVISVLTETRWFKGSLNDLTEARVRTADREEEYGRPAILRKDFVVDKYQIAEAASSGADTVLLIVAVTPSSLLKELIDYARDECDMEPLVEVHAERELDVALEAGARVIGVNNRNLHTFRMDLGTTDRAAEELTKRGLKFHHDSVVEAENGGGEESENEYCLCALSGMSTSSDVDRYRRSGVGMCLIGESLMRSSDPASAIEGLCLNPVDYESQTNAGASGAAYTGGTKLIKVCGITDPDDALEACRAGANLIGIIFAEKSKRRVSAERAKKVVEAVRSFGERSGRTDVRHPPPSMEGKTPPPLRALSIKSRALESAAMGGRPAVVGVFQNQPEEFVRATVERCGLDLVQLHGKEGMEAASSVRCGAPAIRVVDVETDEDGNTNAEGVERLLDALTADPVAILLDTSVKGSKEGGGTGRTFDWTLAEAVQNRGLPVIVAGGLTPANVRDCVSGTRPWGVDVSSGVEASPGKKDHDKVRAFVEGAREAAEEASKGF